ncbi:MAG: enoyl-CoA hydratase [Burkholderiales bacterium]|nr:enoyl-CoA hydratase [Burkholderiales bacterium]
MSIDVNLDNGVLTLCLNRPERKNAFTNAMYTAMAQALEDASADSAVRVVVIKGQPGIFSAGNDIEDFLKQPLDVETAPVFRLLRNISTFPKPLVACVRGAAIGIGTTLLLHCDLVYSNEKSRFGMPFVSLGLCPEAASSLLFPMMAGYHRAAEALMLGEPMDAAHAQLSGLVNKVLPDEEVEAHVAAQVAKLLALPAKSLRTTKMLMKSHLKAQVAQKLDEEAHLFAAMLTEPEAKEAFGAFLQKRKPDFSQFD